MSALSDRFKAKAGSFAQDMKLKKFYATGIGVVRMEMAAGSVAMKHYHEYDHISFLMVGEAIVHTENSLERYGPGSVITIKAGVEHAIEAVTDIVWACAHPTADHPEVHFRTGK